jgi:hypothetical protein
MTRNPIVNALSAALYIALVACTMFFGSELAKLEDTPDTVLAPIAMLSLLTLSAAMMAFIFFYQPIRMYLDGLKEEGVKLLMQTIGTFAVITGLALVGLFLPAFFR